MNEIETDILKTKEYLKTSRKTLGFDFKPYSPVFPDSNEDIRDYLEEEFFSGGKALTICGSGDHIFNLLVRGIEAIDSFDINKVTYYYFLLKSAWIKKMSYSEFCDFYFESLDRTTPIFHLDRLEEFDLDPDTYSFFQALKDEESWKLHYYKESSFYIRPRNFFFDEKNYDKLQSILKNGFSFQFYHTDLKDLPSYLKPYYRYICLSNVGEYFGTISSELGNQYQSHLQEFCTFCKNDIFPYLEENGKAMFYYLFNVKKEELTTPYFEEEFGQNVQKKITYQYHNAYIYQKNK